jgi:hypothetical protein
MAAPRRDFAVTLLDGRRVVGRYGARGALKFRIAYRTRNFGPSGSQDSSGWTFPSASLFRFRRDSELSRFSFAPGDAVLTNTPCRLGVGQ